MENDYEHNLGRLLSYYPHIYIEINKISSDVKKYVLHYGTYYSMNYKNVINEFVEYDNGTIRVNQLSINISLEELTNIINQKIRDEKLKEAIQIINE